MKKIKLKRNVIILLIVIIVFSIYFFLNSNIGKGHFKNFKLLDSKTRSNILKFIFPYKYINIQDKVLLEQINSKILIKSDSNSAFELLENNNLYFYTANNSLVEMQITGILKDKNINCFKATFINSFKLQINKLSEDCKKSIFFIGRLDNKYFYFALKHKINNKKNLLVLPVSNFYNYTSNLYEINQYSAFSDYFANLNEIPFSNQITWVNETARSIQNIFKAFKDFDIVLDYEFQNTELDNYNLVVVPMHQEYVSIEFLDKFINFLKKENKAIFSIGGANFLREVKFINNNIIFLKEKKIDQNKYNLNTFEVNKYLKNTCLYSNDKSLDLGEITNPLVNKNIEYFFFDIKCNNNEKLPLLSVQSFDKSKNSKLIHILSDGIGLNFMEIEYLKLKIVSEINSILNN
jgi:hypothetical protein